MYCPECGNDSGDAKFCPECGANLAGVKEALRGGTADRQGAEAGGSGERDVAGQAAAASAKPIGRLSPAVIWGGFAVLAVIVVVAVVVASDGFGGDAGGGATTATTAAAAVIEADTTGSYRELVDRGNDLYDQGDEAFKSQNFEQGSAYFVAAAEVYAAAWKKQPGDPALGTDYAVALFYSGDIPGALDRVGSVLESDPKYQKGWLNKGIFLSHEARLSEQSGEKDETEKLYEEARAALRRAIAIDPESDAGQQAQASLQELPE